MAKTLYEILEVAPSASLETIQAAYRKAISLYHPDKVAALGQELKELAELRAKEINYAYSVLRNSDKRSAYDAQLRGTAEADSAKNARTREAPASQGAPKIDEGRKYDLWVALGLAMITGNAALIMLPRFIADADWIYDNFSGVILWFALFCWAVFSYWIGLFSFRFGAFWGEWIDRDFGKDFTAVNCRRELLLTFIASVVLRELFFSSHSVIRCLADIVIIIGANAGRTHRLDLEWHARRWLP
jgi:hypothetical protein